MGTDDSRKASHLKTTAKSVCWGTLKACGFAILLLMTAINVWTTLRISNQFEEDIQVLQKEFGKGVTRRKLQSLRANERVRNSRFDAASLQQKDKGIKVLQVLSVVEAVEMLERPPEGIADQVVILGKGEVSMTFQDKKLIFSYQVS